MRLQLFSEINFETRTFFNFKKRDLNFSKKKILRLELFLIIKNETLTFLRNKF